MALPHDEKKAMLASPEGRKVLRDAATWMGIDPLLLPADALSSENRTMAYRSKRMQRVALTVNDRFERIQAQLSASDQLKRVSVAAGASPPGRRPACTSSTGTWARSASSRRA